MIAGGVRDVGSWVCSGLRCVDDDRCGGCSAAASHGIAMIDFDEIGLHDLLELEADGRHIEAAGWYHVEWINSGWGEHHPEVELLGSHKQPRTLRECDAPLIRRHIRAGGIPKAIEALERLYKEASEIEACGSGMFHVNVMGDASDALRAVRGENDSSISN